MEEKKKRRKTRTRLCLILSLLPEDVIINILLKLPVNSLMRLRCVCKYFWSLTTSPTFVNLHLHHANTQLMNNNNHTPLILISYLEKENIQLPSCTSNSSANHVPVFYSWTLKQLILNNANSSPDRSSRRRRRRCPRPAVEDVKIPCLHRSPWVPLQFQIWGSCNGLLCVLGACADDNAGHNCLPCIWNPCTKEFKRLPRTELDMRDGFTSTVQHYGFGYDRTMDDYKVIIWSSFRRPGFHSEGSAINVYTLGTNSWRGVDPPCKPFRVIGKLQASGVYFRGALHWVMNTDHHGAYRKQIVSFDIEAEATREMVPRPPPHGCSDVEGDDWVLQELRGCLCLIIRIRGKSIGVWILKDYGLVNGCWTNLWTIVAEPASPHSFKFDTCSSIPLRFCENGEILILKNRKGLYMYDPKKKRARSIIKTRDIRRGVDHFYMETYIESLVSLKTVSSRSVDPVLTPLEACSVQQYPLPKANAGKL